VRFTRMQHTHLIWIDRSGAIRWPRAALPDPQPVDR
jgi:hypothetical protein